MSFSVIIPSKSAANLVPCIRAIREAGETCRVIVVDDGLIELGVPPNLHVPNSNCWFIDGKQPFVFARNVNIGIRAAGSDDVILLNDDALLKTPQGFSEMAYKMTMTPRGILGAACNNVGNPNQHPMPNMPRGMVRNEPRMLCFVCVYIPRSTIDTVGLLDERFVGYGLDDDDYSLRVRKAGLKLGVFDGCYVDHASLKSSFRGAAGAGGDFKPNMKRFIEKWGVDNWGNDREHSPFRHLFPAEAA